MPPEDFFDEDWEEPSKTQETAVTRPAGGALPGPDAGSDPTDGPGGGPRRRPPRPPRRGGGLPPLEYGRLGMLGGGILLVILVGWLLVHLFSSSGGPSATDKYFGQERQVAGASERSGKALHKLLYTPALKPAQLESKLAAQVKVALDLEAKARAIQPTKQLVNVQPYLLQVLQYRATGLSCLQENAAAALKAHSALAGGAMMAACMQKLLASDVIYADSYSASASQALKSAGITHQVPTSQFVRLSDANLGTPHGFAAIVQRLRPGNASGVHGTGIGAVTANGTTLTSPGPITVRYTNKLSFTVVVEDTGKFQEVSVPVKLTLEHLNATPITVTETVAVISAGDSVTVTIPNVFTNTTTPQVTSAYNVTVTVGPVPGEHSLSNNTLKTTISLKLSS